MAQALSDGIILFLGVIGDNIFSTKINFNKNYIFSKEIIGLVQNPFSVIDPAAPFDCLHGDVSPLSFLRGWVVVFQRNLLKLIL